MLSYPIDEAQALLEQKLSSAQTTRRNCEEDLEFLREQITVCLYNVDCLFPAYFTDMFCRQWRLLLHGYTTGMSCRSAKRRRRPRKTAVARAAPMSRMAKGEVGL